MADVERFHFFNKLSSDIRHNILMMYITRQQVENHNDKGLSFGKIN